MFSQDDDNQGLVMGVLFGVIALVISLVIGLVIYKKNHAAAPAAPVAVAAGSAAAPAAAFGGVQNLPGTPGTPGVAGTPGTPGVPGTPGTPGVADAASVVVQNGVVKFYFATGRAALAAGANEALAPVAKAAADGKTVVISGFHDATGSAAQNAELAKQRALAVRDALQAIGVAPGRIELKKPEQLQGTGSNAEARRVEVAVR